MQIIHHCYHEISSLQAKRHKHTCMHSRDYKDFFRLWQEIKKCLANLDFIVRAVYTFEIMKGIVCKVFTLGYYFCIRMLKFDVMIS